MTVGELKEMLAGVNDDLPVVTMIERVFGYPPVERVATDHLRDQCILVVGEA